MQSRNRQNLSSLNKPLGLTINDYDPKVIEDLRRCVPIKELLNCSAELYDLYIKDHIA